MGTMIPRGQGSEIRSILFAAAELRNTSEIYFVGKKIPLFVVIRMEGRWS